MKFPLLASAGTHTVDVRTNLGAFAFVLDVKDSPCTTSSFAYLVRKRFFDGTRFHRNVPGFVIQGATPPARGKEARSLPVVERIGRLGDATEHPTRKITVLHMTVSP